MSQQELDEDIEVVDMNAAPPRGGAVMFTVSISARLLPTAHLKEPYFRFQFLDGTKVLTAPVGTVGEDGESGGWIRRPTIQKPAEMADDADNPGAEDEEVEMPTDDTAPWVWSRDFGPFESTEKFARAIDGSPGFAIFLADSGGAQGRRYIADCQLDLSAFLGGKLVVEETHGVDNPTTWNENTDLDKDTFAGFNYLSVSVRASHTLLDAELEAALNPLSITIHKAKDLPGARVDLNNERERHLGELDMFHVLHEHCEPVYCLFKFPYQPIEGKSSRGGRTEIDGDTLDAAALDSGQTDNNNGDSQATQEVGHAAIRERVCCTRGVLNAEKARWDYTTVFLAGPMDPDMLFERLDSRPLVVELHDRDILPSAEKATEMVDHFEDLAVKYETAAQARANEKQNSDDAVSLPDIFSVDVQFLADREARRVVAGNDNAFGEASFRMDGLLNRAHELRQGLKRSTVPEEEREELEKSVTVKLTEVIVPRKRRIIPTGDAKIAEWDMCHEEQVCRRLGDYASHLSRMSASFHITRPIHSVSALEKVPLPVFERVVYVFPYDDLEMLSIIRDCIDEVNQTAIPHVSLPSYQLTPAQQEAANDGRLDIIGGFQIVEGNQRLIMVEGLHRGGMAKLHLVLPRAVINATKDLLTTKVFSNPEVLFTSRVYTPFEVDLKMIRLRRPLATILKSPDIYNRANVSAVCFNALHALGEVKKANRMRTLKIMDLFPTVEGLDELESKYGETVTLMDMRGITKKKKRIPVAAVAHRRAAGGHNVKNADGTSKPTFGGAMGLMVASKLRSSMNRVRRKAPTVTKNAAYLSALQNWQPKDFLTGQAKQAKVLRETIRTRKQGEFEEAKNDPTPVYLYGSQKLNSMAAAQRKQREKVAQDTNATYTYAPDFVGQTIAPVDPWAVEQAEKLAAKEKFITPKGFQYPAPRDPEEFKKHPKQLSESQIENLKQSWDGPPGSNANSQRGSLFDDQLLTTEGFNTRSLRSIENFGLMQKDGTMDPNYHRSVHLGGDADARAAEQKKKDEAAAWRAKVVVDSVVFRHTHSLPKGNQLDRLTGMLDGPAKKRGLTADAIPALIPHDPYIEPRDRVAATGKPTTLPKEELGTKPQFETRINPNYGKPKASMALSRRSIPPQSESEKVGAKWAKRGTANP